MLQCHLTHQKVEKARCRQCGLPTLADLKNKNGNCPLCEIRNLLADQELACEQCGNRLDVVITTHDIVCADCIRKGVANG